MLLVLACSCLCAIYWSQLLSGEWRCSRSSADRRCSNYIWVIRNSIGYKNAPYIRDLTVVSVMAAGWHAPLWSGDGDSIFFCLLFKRIIIWRTRPYKEIWGEYIIIIIITHSILFDIFCLSFQGIEYLIEHNLLCYTPEDVAQFLYKGEGLNKTAIGDYLGER